MTHAARIGLPARRHERADESGAPVESVHHGGPSNRDNHDDNDQKATVTGFVMWPAWVRVRRRGYGN
ncbi:hypothetical protein GCM10010169_35180 [Micromonospora fulviviridis]|nr:hypothetical protein GCM10010169_35180 [Micromonospora fulviviridis]